MRIRVFLTVLVVAMWVALSYQFYQTAAAIAANTSLNSVTGGSKLQEAAGLNILALNLATLSLLICIWGNIVVKKLNQLFKPWLILLLVGVFALSSCSGGIVGAQPTTRKVSTLPNEVTFVIDLADVNKQASLAADQKEAFWKGKIPNTREIDVVEYCFKPRLTDASCQSINDPVVIIVVSRIPVTVEWTAPAVVCGQPLPDMSGAFSMQSLEDDGNSTGVYVGAKIVAHIDPENSAKYVASYGYNQGSVDGRDRAVHAARSLENVIRTEMQSLVQTELSNLYGVRSVKQQNKDMKMMFSSVAATLNSTFVAKGITIDSFGYKDGNVYENCEIQKAADASFTLAQQKAQIEAEATRGAISNQIAQDAAYAAATRTVVAAQSDATSKEIVAKAAADPVVITLEWLKRWNGVLPMFGSGSDITPNIWITPPAPAPTGTPMP